MQTELAVLNQPSNYLPMEQNMLPMPVNVAQVVARVDAVKEIVNQVFKDEVHFGKIPGTGEKKTLLKPGFDALCLAFQFSPEFIKQPESIERDNFISIVYKCKLNHTPTGRVIATGDGSCNSKEEKYRWQTTKRKCPICNAEAIIKGRSEYGGGWVCFEKKGGCKAKFSDGDPAIENQKTGQIENDNPWNFHNTLTKMAQKRAGMAAIITACGLSSDFTQDMEDFPEMDRRNDKGFERVDIPEYNPPPMPRYEEEVEAPPTYQMEVQRAMDAIDKELGHCKTKNDFLKLKAMIQVSGQAFKDKSITDKIMNQYYTQFPEQKKAA